MDKQSIAIEVVYALADKQKLLQMTVPAGTTVREESAVTEPFPRLSEAGARGNAQYPLHPTIA